MSLWDRLEPERRERMLAGDAALARLKKHETITQWQQVGQTANDLLHAAMELSGTNRPIGAAYNRAWRELSEHVQNVALLDRATRSHAMWLDSNWESVARWVGTLALNERLSLNHPSVVRRKFDAAHKPPTEKNPAVARQELVQNVVGTAEIVREFRSGVIPPGANVEQLADIMRNFLSVDARQRLIRELQRGVDDDNRLDATAAKRKK